MTDQRLDEIDKQLRGLLRDLDTIDEERQRLDTWLIRIIGDMDRLTKEMRPSVGIVQ
jgi:hypothetical protein